MEITLASRNIQYLYRKHCVLRFWTCEKTGLPRNFLQSRIVIGHYELLGSANKASMPFFASDGNEQLHDLLTI